MLVYFKKQRGGFFLRKCCILVELETCLLFACSKYPEDTMISRKKHCHKRLFKWRILNEESRFNLMRTKSLMTLPCGSPRPFLKMRIFPRYTGSALPIKKEIRENGNGNAFKTFYKPRNRVTLKVPVVFPSRIILHFFKHVLVFSQMSTSQVE